MTYNAELVQQMRANGLPLTQDGNDELYLLVVAGDKDAAQKMIEGNMSLVISKVDTYLGQYPFVVHLRDDLISEGFLGLCIAVDRMANEPPPERANATGFISYWIQHSIGSVIDKESGVGASLRTKQDRRANGQDMPTQVYDPSQIPDRIVDPTTMVELRDVIESCCDTEEDRIIVKMREEGYVDKEIAKAIDAPVTTTYMRRREIYARFLEKSGLKGEV